MGISIGDSPKRFVPGEHDCSSRVRRGTTGGGKKGRSLLETCRDRHPLSTFASGAFVMVGNLATALISDKSFILLAPQAEV